MEIIKYFLLSIIFLSCEYKNLDMDEGRQVDIIKLKNESCEIVLKHVVWGMDNSITYVSNNSDLDDTINEPYYRAIDFFYKLDTSSCQLLICKADFIKRGDKLKVNIVVLEDKFVTFSNYRDKNFKNILYK